MLNAAIVGLGWWGATMLVHLRASKKLRVAYGIDVDSGARRLASEKFGIETHADIEYALADPRIQAVILCSPHRAHCDQIIAAASAGKHVFCEKPLTLSFADAQKAVAAVQRAGVQLGLGHERRFEPPVRRMLNLLESGALGTPLQVEGNFSHDRAAALPVDSWRFSPTESPGGPLTGTGIHLLDLSVAVFGAPVRVHATLSKLSSRYENGDTLAVHAQFAGGGNALISALMTTPFYGRFALFCSKGWVEILDRSHPEQSEGWIMNSHVAGELHRMEFPASSGVAANLEAFADAVEGRQPYAITHASMLHNIAALDGVLRSIAQRQSLDIPFFQAAATVLADSTSNSP